MSSGTAFAKERGVFANVEDVEALWRPLGEDEKVRAAALLVVISDCLRQIAKSRGEDLDKMIESERLLPSVAKAVTVDVLSRVLRQNTEGEAMTQESQTALGYNWQGTYAIPGGGIANAIMKNDLKRLGLRRQRMGVIDLCPEEFTEFP